MSEFEMFEALMISVELSVLASMNYVTNVSYVAAFRQLSIPLGALFVTLLMVVFIGEAIREAFDPKVFSRLR